MGAFFTNVQVETRGKPDATLALVLNALRARAERAGQVEAVAGEPVDRGVLVRVSEAWISVYDEATESQDQDLLEALAADLSRATGGRAVSIIVHDSDILELRLFAAGKRLDLYNSFPDYFGKLSKREKKAAQGKPELWEPVLVTGKTAEDLRAVWAAKPLFAEKMLGETAPLLGLDVDQVCTGYRYASETELTGDGWTRLAFRYAERPAYEREAEGPPELEAHSYNEEAEVAVGYSVQLAWSVRNVGRASLGFSLVFWGDAIERGLVSVGSVNVVVGPPELEQRFEAAVEASRASFPEAPIPAGVADLASAMQLAPDKVIDAMYRSVLHANVELKGLARGEGELGVGFLAHEDPEIQFGYSVRVTVPAPPRRPLRAEPDANTAALKPLEETSTLLAMISFDLPRVEAGERAVPLIEQWGRCLGGKKIELAIMPADPEARPTTAKHALSRFFDGSDWHELKNALSSVSSVHGEASGAGFNFCQARNVFVDKPSDPELPVLGLWKAARNASAQDEQRLVELIEQLMVEQHGMQAIVCRWGWTPNFGIDATPYEQACGVGGQCTLRRSWLSRYLRAIAAGTVWLGPALVQALGDVEPLRKVAQVVPLEGGSLRVKIGAEQLDAAERAMACLLPGTDEWQAAVRALYEN